MKKAFIIFINLIRKYLLVQELHYFHHKEFFPKLLLLAKNVLHIHKN